MILDLDKLHKYKNNYQRQNGKSVDAIIDVIGKVQVTQNMVVPFVIEGLEWERHLSPMFHNLVVDHFNERPIIRDRGMWWGIEDYSTRVRLISNKSGNWRDSVRGYNITTPTFDLDQERINFDRAWDDYLIETKNRLLKVYPNENWNTWKEKN